MILCITAHAVFEKGLIQTSHSVYILPVRLQPLIDSTLTLHPAAKYFGVKAVKVGCRENSYEADVDQIRKSITSNTILIIASAPQFPHGNALPSS